MRILSLHLAALNKVLSPFVMLVLLTSTAHSAEISAQNLPLPDIYPQRVGEIIANRCAVCHGCTEAPCQLKLTSYAGLRRGSSKEAILDAHIRSRLPSRMKDATSLGEWRRRNFSPVVSDQPGTSPEENKSRSVLVQAITAGMKNTPGSIDTSSLFRYYSKDTEVCPADSREYETFLAQNPASGMPLGLPALNQDEYNTLVSWIESGAPAASEAEKARTAVHDPIAIEKWENFFNASSPKERLIARYVFEHMSGMRFHFKESPGQYFEVVRSRTASPQPISEIATETAASNPGSGPFFYRMKKLDEILVKKNHIVWDAGLEEIQRLKTLFNSAEWKVPAKMKMSYTGNPFHDFKAIPAAIRSRFLITHSQLMIDQMTRGNVCMGSQATYAIRDHFWVMFLKPEADPSVRFPGLGLYRLEMDDNANGLLEEEISTHFSRVVPYQNAFEDNLRKIRPQGLSLKDIWLGKSEVANERTGDPNARITVFRHETISSAHNGWIGGRPKTAWILSYSNFERLYYNLVVNYKYWGNLYHRARTWDIMRTIRQEGEELFLSLIPLEMRGKVRDQWTTGWERGTLGDYELRTYQRSSNVMIKNAKDPVGDILAQMNDLFPPSKPEIDDSLNQSIPVGAFPLQLPSWVTEGSVRSVDQFESGLRHMTNRHDMQFPRVLPSMMVIHLRVDEKTDRVYTVIANRGFAGHGSPIDQMKQRRPGDDYISVFPGILGSHPNLYVSVDLRSNAGEFLRDMSQLNTSTGIGAFRAKYGITRDSQNFWEFNDSLNAWYMKRDPVHGARLDLNAYDNGRGYE